MFVPTYPIIFFILNLFLFFYFQGLNLLELATHLEEKAAQLRCEGLGKIKIALASMDTSSLLDILQGYFGCVDSLEGTESVEESNKDSTTEEKTPEVIEKTPITLPDVGGLATAELVFPLKSILTVVAGLPKSYLPHHGPETLSQYHCQFPSCTLEFSQKAAACNHVSHGHLNIALACLYCSFENNLKMQWYSASTWEHHSLKHLKENIPIHPDDPEFSKQFACAPGDDAIPSTSTPRQNLPHKEVIRKQAEAAKQFFKGE